MRGWISMARLRVAGRSVQVSARDAGVAAATAQDAADLRATIDALTTHPTLALQLSTQTLIADVPTNLHGATARSARGRGAAASARPVRATPSTRAQLNATATLDARAAGAARQCARTRLSRPERARLLAPATCRSRDGLAIDRLRLGVGDSVLAGAGASDPGTGSERVAARSEPGSAAPVAAALAKPMAASTSISAAREPARHPTGQRASGGARAARARRRGTRACPPLTSPSKHSCRHRVAQLDAQLNAGQRLQLHVTGQAPLSRTAPIALKIGGSFDLLLVDPILEAGGQRLQGEAKLDADIAGTLAAPQARGTLQLTHADLQDYPRGSAPERTSARRSRPTATSWSCSSSWRTPDPGTMSVSGSLGLGRRSAAVAQARSPQRAAIEQRPDHGQCRHELHARGARCASSSKPRAVCTSFVPSSTFQMRCRRASRCSMCAGPARGRTGSIQFAQGQPRISTVDAPRAIFVRGRGLDAELGGSLHVGGTSNDPAISGGFDTAQRHDQSGGLDADLHQRSPELQRQRRQEEDRSNARLHGDQHRGRCDLDSERRRLCRCARDHA